MQFRQAVFRHEHVVCGLVQFQRRIVEITQEISEKINFKILQEDFPYLGLDLINKFNN